MERKMSEGGLRYNSGKLPYHLLSNQAIEEVVKVLAFGATKYAERNWEKGLKWDSGVAASLQRHLAAWKLGEDFDQETELPHLAHIMCNAMFLLHYFKTSTGTDDRPLPLKKAQAKTWEQIELEFIALRD
jgi:hypothetical protein